VVETRTPLLRLSHHVVSGDVAWPRWPELGGARALGCRPGEWAADAPGRRPPREAGASALRQRLAQSQVVAAGVADGGVADAVGLVDGLLEDLRPGGTQRLEGLVQIVDLNEDRQVALGDNLAHRLPVGRRDVMALAGALAASVHTVTGQITNKSLRALVTTLLATPYTSNRMSYDLRRLRLKGLIERIEGTNAYRITPDGQRFAVFYTKPTPQPAPTPSRSRSGSAWLPRCGRAVLAGPARRRGRSPPP
jgi:hypothetical protein